MKALTPALRVEKKNVYGIIEARRNKDEMERRMAWIRSGPSTEDVQGPVVVVVVGIKV